MAQENQIQSLPWKFATSGNLYLAADTRVKLLGGDIVLPPYPRDGRTITVQIVTANLHQIASEIRVATLPAGQTIGAGQPGGTASNVFLLEAASEAQASEMVGMELVFTYSSASNNWYVVPNQSSGSFAAIASYVPTAFAGLVVVVDGAGQGDGLYRWKASTSSYVFVGGQ